MGCLKISYYADVVRYSDDEAFNSVASLTEFDTHQSHQTFGGGSLMPGRHGTADTYRYGFNGMLKDDKIKNVEGSSYDFGARMYDSRLGRWFKTDGREKEYSCFSPYNFGLNNPIYYVDSDGNVIWDPVNNEVVVVSFNKRGKPQYILQNGKPVSNVFVQSVTETLTSLGKSEQGKQLVNEMMGSPTKIVLQEDMRVRPDGEIYERASKLEPDKKRNGETKMTDGGDYLDKVKITPYIDFIRKKARKNNIDFDELLLGVMTVEVGHLRAEQVKKEAEMQNSEGYGRDVDGPILDDVQAKTKANYEPLFNEASMRQYLYRIEKNQLVT